jgi:DNA repair protein RecO (recombination protein O)
MNWSDEAIILSVRPHGETSAVVEVFSREHGRHLGLVHGGRSRKARPVLQTGNHVDAAWKARLAENLGMFTIEPRRAFAAEVMDDPAALGALSRSARLRVCCPSATRIPASTR